MIAMRRSFVAKRLRGEHEPVRRFTPRRLEIIDFLLEGFSAPQIAEQTGLRPKTVKNHMSTIYELLGVQSHVQLLAHALQGRRQTIEDPQRWLTEATDDDLIAALATLYNDRLERIATFTEATLQLRAFDRHREGICQKCGYCSAETAQ